MKLNEIFYDMFKNMDKDTLASSPCRIDVETYIKSLKNYENILTLDIRTGEELGFTEFKAGKVFNIPMNELFSDKNIEKLDKQANIIVLCHTGIRAVAVATLLNLLGFNAKALKGGWVSIAEYLSAKTS